MSRRENPAVLSAIRNAVFACVWFDDTASLRGTRVQPKRAGSDRRKDVSVRAEVHNHPTASWSCVWVITYPRYRSVSSWFTRGGGVIDLTILARAVGMESCIAMAIVGLWTGSKYQLQLGFWSNWSCADPAYIKGRDEGGLGMNRRHFRINSSAERGNQC